MDIKAYILKYITKLKNGETEVNTLIQMFGLSLCSQANIERTSDIDSLISTILTGYQNGLYSDAEAVNLLEMISTGDIEGLKLQLSSLPSEAALEEVTGYEEASYGSYYGGGGGGSSSSSSKNDAEDVTTNIETDDLLKVTTEYGNIESELMSIELTIPTLVATYASKIKTDVDTGKKEISKSLTKLKTSMVEILNINSDLDESIKDIDMESITFTNINKVIYDRSKNSKPIELTKEEFEKLGYEVDEKGNVHMTINNIECRYNLKNHRFYSGKNEAFEVFFYIPENALSKDKCSKLNTYTFFNNSGYKNLIGNQETNAVIARITKYPSDHKFDKYDETALATKFINKVAGTKFSEGCRNIIAGDSVYGSHALQIAAKHKDTYQTVYCVNNAAIVTGENGRENFKTQFSSVDELKGLNGKDIYFISTSGDENFDRGMASKNWSDKVPFEEGFTYTGLDVVCKYCPKAKVHMVYNESGSNHDDLVSLLKGLSKKYSNYSYDAGSWEDFADVSYTTHSQGNIVVNEAMRAAVTNYNSNTA